MYFTDTLIIGLPHGVLASVITAWDLILISYCDGVVTDHNILSGANDKVYRMMAGL